MSQDDKRIACARGKNTRGRGMLLSLENVLSILYLFKKTGMASRLPPATPFQVALTRQAPGLGRPSCAHTLSGSAIADSNHTREGSLAGAPP